MKKIFIICICLCVYSSLQGQVRLKNSGGFSAGIVPGGSKMYFGLPWDFSPNREVSTIYQFFYARQVQKMIRIGVYAELERVRFTDQSGSNTHSFGRRNIGINGLVQFPQKPLHIQAGAYLGYGYLKANNWTNLTGFDYGGIVGPAYEKGNIGAAIQLHTGYAHYKSSGTPSEVKLYNPKILFKIYYRF